MNKTFMILMLPILLFAARSMACEPPPAVGALCRSTKQFKFNEASANQLIEALENYDGKLRKILKKENPRVLANEGNGSCFLSNYAKNHLEKVKRHIKKNKGKICEFDYKLIIDESKRLVSLKSPEFKVIQSRRSHKTLRKLRREVAKSLQGFHDAHKGKRKR